MERLKIKSAGLQNPLISHLTGSDADNDVSESSEQRQIAEVHDCELCSQFVFAYLCSQSWGLWTMQI